MPYANNKGIDSAFFICYLDSVIPLVSLSKLASLCSRAGQFESYLVGNREDRFSNEVAQKETLL